MSSIKLLIPKLLFLFECVIIMFWEGDSESSVVGRGGKSILRNEECTTGQITLLKSTIKCLNELTLLFTVKYGSLTLNCVEKKNYHSE